MKRRNNESALEELLKLDSFIEEILAVCKKHNMSISHEDSQGAFIVTEPFDDYNATWFQQAQWEGSED